MRVLIACPVKDREWILPYYLDYITRLNYDKSKINLYFIVNNSIDRSYKILQSFQDYHKDMYESITLQKINNHNVPTDERMRATRRGHTYYWLAELRNMLLAKCVELDCDYLLSCDCDILMKTNTLIRLLAHNEHCVSSLVYNGYIHNPEKHDSSFSCIENAHLFSNCLIFDEDKKIYVHIRNKRIKEPDKNPVGTTIVTHITGACILISKELASKAKYGYFYIGEDEHFCRQARMLGYNVLCDVSLLNPHIMSKMLLKLYLDGLMPKVY